jgi:baculoviral IAP repeat-containing protein 7/8
MFVDLVCADKTIKNFVLKHHPPKHRAFITESSRVKSYENSPKNIRDKAETLAKSGLFYYEGNNSTICFHCNGELVNWQPRDDVFCDHARWFPSCLWINLIKGRSFVEQSRISHASFLESLKKRFEQDVSGLKYSMRSEDVAFYIKCGIPPEVLWKINEKFVKEKGRSFLSRREMSEAVSAGLSYDGGFKPPEIKTPEREKQNIDPICIVCRVEEKNITFVPCGHLAACGACCAIVERCPYCRMRIEGVFKTYIV